MNMEAKRLVGGLLAASFLIPLIGVILLAIGGKARSVYAAPGDPSVDFVVNRWTMRVAIWTMLLAVFGFALLSAQLNEAGGGAWAWVGLAGMLMGSMGWIIEISLTFGIAETAAREAVQSGSIPSYAEALKVWVNQALQPAYVLAGMVASVAYGVGVLQTGLATRAVGWAAIIWGALWGTLAIVGPLTIPAVILFSALIFGVGLLF